MMTRGSRAWKRRGDRRLGVHTGALGRICYFRHVRCKGQRSRGHFWLE